MTTTKEDQIRDEFEEWFKSKTGSDNKFGYDEGELWWAWEACAESYEKKLAEKAGELTISNAQVQALIGLLSEANARNAMLVKAVTALTGVCITQVGADYNDTIHAAYILGMDAIAANKGKEVV